MQAENAEKRSGLDEMEALVAKVIGQTYFGGRLEFV